MPVFDTSGTLFGPAAPVNVTPPVITGSATVGALLAYHQRDVDGVACTDLRLPVAARRA